MYFDLDEDQRRVCDTVDRLLGDLIDPVALTTGRAGADTIRSQLDPALAELGIATIMCAADKGGAGLGLLGLTAVAERLGRHAAPTTIQHSALAAWLVAEHGPRTMCEKWLDRLFTGEVTATFAFGKTGCASPEDWSASTEDECVERLVVQNPGADLVIVRVRDGLAALHGEKVTFDESKQDLLDVTRPFGAARFALGDAAPIGDRAVAERVFDALLILAGADAAGAGCRTLEMAADYAKTREQFGRPIGSFQGLKHNLANIAVDIEPVQFLCWYAAHAWDTEQDDSSRMAALAKAHACDMAVKAARASVEAHGGIGYTWEYPLHIYLKRAMFDQAVLASSRRLRERVAALTS